MTAEGQVDAVHVTTCDCSLSSHILNCIPSPKLENRNHRTDGCDQSGKCLRIRCPSSSSSRLGWGGVGELPLHPRDAGRQGSN